MNTSMVVIGSSTSQLALLRSPIDRAVGREIVYNYGTFFFIQFTLDHTDLRYCLASTYDLEYEAVNISHVQWSGIVMGEEDYECTEGPTTHFPEVTAFGVNLLINGFI